MAEITQQDKDNAKLLFDKGLISKKDYENITNPPESFSTVKLQEGLVSLTNKVKWAKSFTQDFSLRTILIRLVLVAILIGGIYAWGWWKGKQNTPAHFHIDYDNEMTISIPNGASVFSKPKGSAEAYWIMEDGSKKKVVIKDIPELAKALKPYGITMEPFATAGASIGASGGKFGEVGVGMEWARYYKTNINSFITTNGLYPVGIGYKLTSNTDLLLGGGIGWKGDTRVYFGAKIKFGK